LRHKGERLVLPLHDRCRVTDRLLVVDADDELRRAYASHFSRCGFDVHCAATIAHAASLLDAAAYDALIADVREVPADDRGDLSLGRLLNRDAPPRVVVLTAYGEPERAAAAARLGVDAFLHKPVSLVWLESLLRSRIEQVRSRGDGEVAATG
jgi:DNA-binding NtrC family response regulator